MTRKVYQENSYLKEYTATVLRSEGDELILDATIFAPDSGGQPWDLGTIGGVPLAKVTEKGGEVIHVLKKGANAFAEGDSVQLVLDWERRFDHMQNHLGEHILSGLFKSEYDLDNMGFHLGEKEGTFDINAKTLTQEMLDHIEEMANEVVYQAIPVKVEMIRDLEEAAKYPLRKELKVDEDIIVVSVPGVDCVACCCPHPADTSQIGIIKLIGTEKYKGMTRVHFLCGRRALMDYRQKHRVVVELNEKYSADEFSLLGKINKAEEKSEAVRRELNSLKTGMARAAAAGLIADADTYIAHSFSDADMDQIRLTAKLIMEESDLPVMLISESTKSVLIAHSGKAEIQCGKLVKELAEGGRGGGSPTQAQAVFQEMELLYAFADKVINEFKK